MYTQLISCPCMHCFITIHVIVHTLPCNLLDKSTAWTGSVSASRSFMGTFRLLAGLRGACGEVWNFVEFWRGILGSDAWSETSEWLRVEVGDASEETSLSDIFAGTRRSRQNCGDDSREGVEGAIVESVSKAIVGLESERWVSIEGDRRVGLEGERWVGIEGGRWE